jgi:Zn-dependent peptidase ImmA (M78 family)
VADTRPSAVKVKDFRLYELERIAADALRDAGACVKGRRVDIERLILEKFKLKIESFAELRRRWDAYAFIDAGGKVIYIDAELMNEERHEKKYRFTLAEELAHFLIHRQLFANCHTIADRMKIEEALDERTLAYMESNAKALASAILMPKTCIEPLVESLAGKLLDVEGHILVDKLVSTLADEYDVNFQAAKRRMRNLGYRQRLGLDLQ